MRKIISLVLTLLLVFCLCACTENTNSDINPDNGDNQVVSGTEQGSSKVEKENVTMGQKNALKKAKDYLKIMAFSKKGLISQLEFEGYSNEEASYGAENCGADWKEQAAKKAKSYLDLMAFSREGLIEQLEFEGYTSEEAEYGATANGY